MLALERLARRGSRAVTFPGRGSLNSGARETGSPVRARLWSQRRSEALSKDVVVLTDDNWKTEVSEATGPVLVDFWAEWCAPCRMIGPAVAALAATYAGRVKVG